MKRVLLITGCLALTLAASGAQNRPEENRPAAPKKPAPRSVPVPQRGGAPALGTGVGRTYYQQRPVEPIMRGRDLGQRSLRETTPRMSGAPSRTTTGQPANVTSTSPNPATKTTTIAPATRTFQPRRFNLPTQTKPTTAPRVTYQPGRRIPGSETWRDRRYTAFRDYTCTWHDRYWYHRHYDRIVFVFGGSYFWNAGYWYPAWGYDPYAYYSYDGPIYAYDDLPPDQVIANVQAALADQGYYDGAIDGILGPLTRAAIARYQQDHGLYVTSAVDEPTLASLGMV
jgi:Putative peptidoglycan binding domain